MPDFDEMDEQVNTILNQLVQHLKDIDEDDSEFHHDIKVAGMRAAYELNTAQLLKLGVASIPSLTEAINSPVKEIRREAAWALARLPAASESNSALLSILTHDDDELRLLACGQLTGRGSPEFFGRLLSLLDDPSADVRAAAVAAVFASDPDRALTVFLKRDGDAHPKVVNATARQFAKHGDERCIRWLERHLKQHSAAREALDTLAPEQALAAFIEAYIRTEDPGLRAAFLGVVARTARPGPAKLEQESGPLSAAFLGLSSKQRKFAVTELSKLDSEEDRRAFAKRLADPKFSFASPDGIELLKSLCESAQPGWWELAFAGGSSSRRDALRRMLELAEAGVADVMDTVEALKVALRDPDGWVVREAARVAQLVRDERLPRMLARAAFEKPNRHSIAEKELGKAISPYGKAGVRAVLEALQEEADPLERWGAAYRLEQSIRPETERLLIEYLSCPNAPGARPITELLGEHGSPAAADALSRSGQGGDAGLDTALALAKRGDARAAPRLIEHLKGTDNNRLADTLHFVHSFGPFPKTSW